MSYTDITAYPTRLVFTDRTVRSLLLPALTHAGQAERQARMVSVFAARTKLPSWVAKPYLELISESLTMLVDPSYK